MGHLSSLGLRTSRKSIGAIEVATNRKTSGLVCELQLWVARLLDEDSYFLKAQQPDVQDNAESGFTEQHIGEKV
jgi:hypothetical protein